jgi:hypothetical protein
MRNAQTNSDAVILKCIKAIAGHKNISHEPAGSYLPTHTNWEEE